MTTTSTTWPSVSALNSAITSEVTYLQTVLPHVDQLTKNMQALQGSLTVPSLLTQQLTDIQTIFEGIILIFDFIDQIDVLDDVFAQASQTIKSQLTQSTQISTGIPELEATIKSIGASGLAASKQLPSSTTISAATSTLSGWSHGANALVSMFDTISATKLTSEQQSTLKSIKQQIISRCEDLTTIVKAFNTTTTGILTNVHGLNGTLCDYAASLQPIAQHSNLISQSSMPAVNRAAQIMNKINAILNPLSLVLDVGVCAHSSGKESAKVAIDLAKSTATASATSHANIASSLINEFVTVTSTGYLPIQPLYDDVEAASKTLGNKVVASFEAHVANLQKSLATLNQQLTAKYSYSINGKVQTNQFMDDLMVTSLQTLLANIPQH
jgi:hypothetical protein